MTDTSFRALILRATDEKHYAAHFEQLTDQDLPDGDVTVAVEYSDLNFKDGLAVTGKGRIVRKLPLVPGIDLAGKVIASQSTDFQPGDPVVLTGWGVGESYWGGYSQRARVRSDWLVPLPASLDTRQAMAIGTAGFTSMQCVMALEEAGITPDSGPIVVTGAGGGVGSLAVAILAKLGYSVTAVTGRPEIQAYLSDMGASDFITREEMNQPPRPLEKARWAGGVDTVGGTTLVRLLAEVQEWGAVAACGLAGGHELPGTVMPFILRGVRLQGIHSVTVPKDQRLAIWQRLGQDLPLDKLEAATSVEPLSRVPELAEAILDGKVRGRTLIDVNA